MADLNWNAGGAFRARKIVQPEQVYPLEQLQPIDACSTAWATWSGVSASTAMETWAVR
jgi:hypothetical protein